MISTSPSDPGITSAMCRWCRATYCSRADAKRSVSQSPSAGWKVDDVARAGFAAQRAVADRGFLYGG